MSLNIRGRFLLGSSFPLFFLSFRRNDTAYDTPATNFLVDVLAQRGATISGISFQNIFLQGGSFPGDIRQHCSVRGSFVQLYLHVTLSDGRACRELTENYLNFVEKKKIKLEMSGCNCATCGGMK